MAKLVRDYLESWLGEASFGSQAACIPVPKVCQSQWSLCWPEARLGPDWLPRRLVSWSPFKSWQPPVWFLVVWIHLWLWHVKTYAFHEAVQGDAQDEPEELVTSSANSCSTAGSDSPQMNTNEVVFNSTVFWAISQEELSPTDQASSLRFFFFAQQIQRSKLLRSGRTSFAISCHGQRPCHGWERYLFQETE